MIIQRLTRGQIFILISEITIPLIVLIFLLIINPSYESELFISKLGRFILAIAIISDLLGGTLLFASFGIINHFISYEDGSTSLRLTLVGFASIIILTLFTFTSLILIILGPAFIRMVENQIQ